jgi:hypothetical protein
MTVSQPTDLRLYAPATARNRDPIAAVLKDWLPAAGRVLEVGSGTGEHAVHFARNFPDLEWQPTDPDPEHLGSIRAWREWANLPNLLPPLAIDVTASEWPVASADVVLSINMVHISPWEAALGLIDGAGRLLGEGQPLILYGPWIVEGLAMAASNFAFDLDLKRRNPRWGLRRVSDFASAAEQRGFTLAGERSMPANNTMLLFRKR